MFLTYTPDDGLRLDDDRNSCTVFLAGSIENGTAPEWQGRVVDALRAHYDASYTEEDPDVVVYNPRKSGWDATIRQSTDDPNLVMQVLWELKRIRRSHIVLFHFVAGTQSPVSLLELGLVLGGGTNAVVSVEPGFYRAANIQITCAEFGVPCFPSLDSGIAALRHMMTDLGH